MMTMKSTRFNFFSIYLLLLTQSFSSSSFMEKGAVVSIRYFSSTQAFSGELQGTLSSLFVSCPSLFSSGIILVAREDGNKFELQEDVSPVEINGRSTGRIVRIETEKKLQQSKE